MLYQIQKTTHTRIPVRPVLRWYGGKWRIAEWLIALMPQHHVYVEPFSGSFSVGMRKPRVKVEVFNDLDERLVNLFRVLRDPQSAARLHELLELTPYAFREYMNARERAADPIEDARRLLVLGAQSHGATGAVGGKLSGWRRGHREMKDGSANSYASEWVRLRDEIPRWVSRLDGVYIECDDAMNIIRRWDGPQTLIYVDPPYLHSQRSNTRKVYRHELDNFYHASLAECLHSSTSMVMLSHYRCGLYDDLYSGWHRYDFETRADSNALRVESVYLNPAAAAASPQLDMFEAPSC